MSGDPDTIRLVDQLERARPDLVRLARLVCLAARVDAVLLRRMRRSLLPEAGPGVEAELWFSPLVETAGVSGFTLDPDVADLLRETLALTPGQPVAVRRERRELLVAIERILTELHADAPPAIRLEEQVTLMAIRGDPAAEIEEALRPAVMAMVQEEDRGLEMARWVMRALPRLPARARQTETALMLALGASARLGDRPVLPPADSHGDLTPRLAWTLPPGRLADRVGVPVRLVAGGITFLAPKPKPEPGELALPQTQPLLAELSWTVDGRAARRTVFVEPGRVVPLPVGASSLTIRTLAGDEYSVGPADGRKGGSVSEEYQHDLYISYARVDNVPLASSDEGWVSRLIDALRALLKRRLGREVDVWMDLQLVTTDSWPPSIEESLRRMLS